jgi:hypothetical protein
MHTHTHIHTCTVGSSTGAMGLPGVSPGAPAAVVTWLPPPEKRAFRPPLLRVDADVPPPPPRLEAEPALRVKGSMVLVVCARGFSGVGAGALWGGEDARQGGVCLCVCVIAERTGHTQKTLCGRALGDSVGGLFFFFIAGLAPRRVQSLSHPSTLSLARRRPG